MRAVPRWGWVLVLLLGCDDTVEDRAVDSALDGATTDAATEDDLGQVVRDAAELPPDGASPPAEDAGGPECVFRDAGSLVRAVRPAVDAGVVIEPGTPVAADGLVAYWPLDSDWRDHAGAHHLTADRADGFGAAPRVRGPTNGAYGPTGAEAENGARGDGLVEVSDHEGVTLEGWFLLPGNSARGQLFGFGGGEWDQPKLAVRSDWGFLTVVWGQREGSGTSQHARLGDGCWHHVALVVAADAASHVLFVDGVAEAAVDIGDASFFGRPFQAGRFFGAQGPGMRLDEVRVWRRALEAAEVARLATPSGGPCPGTPPPEWAPGPRCAAPVEPVAPAFEVGVRVLSDDVVVFITDPSDWLRARVEADCGAFLTALEAQDDVPEWIRRTHYFYAVMETLEAWRPLIHAAVGEPGHVAVTALGGEACAPVEVASAHSWPQGLRELRVPAVAPGEGEVWTHRAEVAWFTYLRLAEPMRSRFVYDLRDRWGHGARLDRRQEVSAELTAPLSYAIKVNQVGYAVDGPKRAYVGAWLAQGGPMAFPDLEGAPFRVGSPAHGQVFEGRVALRTRPDADAPNPDGEVVYELDFSALDEPGQFQVTVPGVGRSWWFEVGDDAPGGAFFVHARGLFHQRCAALDAAHTAWPRGDAHATFRGGFPPDAEDYRDHAADGWGFLDAEGRFPAGLGLFDAVAATATDEVLPEVHGGWHDAGDFDRNPRHFEVVRALVQTFLAAPERFADGELQIPESGNGVADILDEAAWGVEVWRRAQQADGRVATRIEATSHPVVFDPGADPQRYYLALATRSSSLDYAAHAALVGRALDADGARFVESARRAYAFGTDPAVRVTTEFETDAGRVRWEEPPVPPARRRLHAAIQLWLATDDPVFRAALDAPDLTAAFDADLAALVDRRAAFDVVDVALRPDAFPDGWGARAAAAIQAEAAVWLAHQATHAYRKLWHPPHTDAFSGMAWGNHHAAGAQYVLAAAWRVSPQTRYRDGVVAALDWLHGANPQGRVFTTGLGHHRTVDLLHLPSLADDHAEPVPGLTIFGYPGGLPFQFRTHVHGLFEGPADDFGYPGVAIDQTWNGSGADTGAIGDTLYATIPAWRRLLTLERALVSSTEFTVHDPMAPAIALTGMLRPAAWRPFVGQATQPPPDDATVRESRWLQP